MMYQNWWFQTILLGAATALTGWRLCCRLEDILHFKGGSFKTLYKAIAALTYTLAMLALSTTDVALRPHLMVLLVTFFQFAVAFGAMDEKPYPVSFAFLAVMINVVCDYNLANALIRMVLWPNVDPSSRIYLVTIFAMGQMMSLIRAGLLHGVSEAFPTRDVAMIAHSPRDSRASYVFMWGNAIALNLVNFICYPLMRSQEISTQRVQILFTAITIWTLLSGISNYALVLVEAKRASEREKTRQMEKKLYREAAFLRASTAAYSANYVVNLTENRVVEGSKELLKTVEESGGTYTGWLERFFYKGTVHPKDEAYWQNAVKLEFYIQKYQEGGTFTEIVRMNPTQLGRAAGFSEENTPFDCSRDWIWMQLRFTVVKDPDGELFMFVKDTDITAEVEVRRTLRREAETDALTGCFNRKKLETYAESYLKQEGAKGALFMIDLDYFKQINDSMGHGFGDELLVEISRLIRSLFRSQDVVARLGGDEFCVFLAGTDALRIIREKAAQMTQRARRTISTEFGSNLHTSLSVGIALFPKDGTTYEELYKRADEALYLSKQMGRDRYTFYDQEDWEAVCKEEEALEPQERGITDSDYRDIVNSLVTVGIYVISAADHRLLFFNKRVQEVAPNIKLGDICHQVWDGFCENCPLLAIGDSSYARTVSYNDPFGKEVEITATKMLWKNKIPAYTIRIYPRMGFDAKDVWGSGEQLNQEENRYGYYEVDEEHRILNSSGMAKLCYPQLTAGEYCYKCLMNYDEPCGNCPIHSEDPESNPSVAMRKILQNGKTHYRLTFRAEPDREYDSSPLGSTPSEMLGSFKELAYYCGDREDLPLQHEDILHELLRVNSGVGLIAGYSEGNFPIQFISTLALEILRFPSFEAFEKQTGRNMLTMLRGDITMEELHEQAVSTGGFFRNGIILGYQGAPVPVHLRGRVLDSQSGKRMWYASIRSIDDAFVDSLTGGYNRAGLIARLEQMRTDGVDMTRYMMMYLNVEKFKAINELYGTQGGDNLLRIIYLMLSNSALQPILVGRMESDHFLALFESENFPKADFSDLETIDWNFKGKSTHVGVQCGIYQIEGSRMSASGMIDRARMATEYVHDERSQPYAIYDRSMRSTYMARAEVIAEHMAAIRNREFMVYYQPVVDAQTGKVVSAEALVRWMHPNKGLISPGLFMPVLEETGAIYRVDEFVNRSVYDFQKKRQAEGKLIVPVSVNLSWMDFREKDMIDGMMHLALDGGLPGGHLRYEVTETGYTALESSGSSVLQRMHEQGVKLLLDDFGSGVSTFGMIQSYDFDLLKLDMSFVRQIEGSEKVRPIVRSIIALCHELKIQVIAEGVETQGQLDFLREAGCDMIQGYYFAKPMDEESFIRYLDEQE